MCVVGNVKLPLNAHSFVSHLGNLPDDVAKQMR